jgi:hypothetical protein
VQEIELYADLDRKITNRMTNFFNATTVVSIMIVLFVAVANNVDIPGPQVPHQHQALGQLMYHTSAL